MRVRNASYCVRGYRNAGVCALSGEDGAYAFVHSVVV